MSLLCIIGCFHCSVLAEESGEFTLFLRKADGFLVRYVQRGEVNYDAITGEPATLEALLSTLAELKSMPPRGSTLDKAFWINVYNICTIDMVRSFYPMGSPLDVGDFFDRKEHEIGGELFSLNEIERNKLISVHNDPRIHFAIVCAAKGCPPILGSAYYPDNVDSRLDERARFVINDERWVRVDSPSKTIYLSKIFEWYREEFERDAGSLVGYVGKYHAGDIPDDIAVRFMEYDWSLNALSGEGIDLQSYTPGKLLLPGQIEVKEFLNLYTQTEYFDDDAERRKQNSRSTYFTSTTSVGYGFKRNVNLGFDLYLKSVLNDDEDASAFEILSFPSDDNARTALTGIAPKVKISPIRSIPTLSIQTLLLIPFGDDFEDVPFLDYNGVQWWTQLFYDYSVGGDFLVYVESDYYWRLDTDIETFVTPLKLILQYYPADRWTVYGLGEYSPSWNDGSMSAYYTQLGFGLKYQLLPNLEVESLVSMFPAGRNKGAGSTVNLGLRFLR